MPHTNPSATRPGPQDEIQTEDTAPSIVSQKPLASWKGSLTTFQGVTNTKPDKEFQDASWETIADILCPDEPVQLPEKKDGQYFVPCPLKEGPLVGKTRELAEKEGKPTEGKMRSKSHITDGSMISMDVDGLIEDSLDAALREIEADGITYRAYTTHSHGDPQKPGMRVRFVFPLDRKVNNEEYNAVWKGLNQRYFDGQADSTSANIYQQQGTWCCDPDRRSLAQKWGNDNGIASADALIKLGGGIEHTQSDQLTGQKEQVECPPLANANQIADRCNQIGQFRDPKGAGQHEPLWFDCLGITGHCIDGEAISQDWSSGHEGYDEGKTAKKIAHRLQMPPTTCDQFRKAVPTLAEFCSERYIPFIKSYKRSWKSATNAAGRATTPCSVIICFHNSARIA